MARYLGIDIGETALRGALVRSSLRKVDVERYVEIPLSEPEGSPGRTAELLQAGRALREALALSPDVIVAAVAGEEASLRLVELPAAAKKRLAEVLPFELEAVLPYDPHEAVIDYQLIDTQCTTLRVLAASVLQRQVRSTLDHFMEIGLEPHELAAGAAALDGAVNLVPELKDEGPVLLIDVADHRIDLCLLQAGHCVAARTLGYGLSDMPAQAEATERELQRTLAGFRGAGTDEPTAVYVSGVGSESEAALGWLSGTLAHEVKPLVLPNATAGDAPARGVFGKAAALAARALSAGHRIDLRKGEFAPAHTRGQLLQYGNLIVVGLVVVILSAMISLKAQQKVLADEQQVLRDNLSKVTETVLGKTVTDPALAEAMVKNPKTSDPLPVFDAYDAVAAVSAAIPPDVAHEVRRLRVDVADEKREGQLELVGLLESLGKRDKVVDELRKHPCFHELVLGKTSPTGTDTRINYTIEATVQCAGPSKEKKRPAAEVAL